MDNPLSGLAWLTSRRSAAADLLLGDYGSPVIDDPYRDADLVDL